MPRHTATTQREAIRPYEQRSYIISKLDDAHIDAACQDDMLLGLNGYCLDALCEIPAGCMRHAPMWPAQHYALRGVSLVEQQAREALAARLIAEILAEEAATTTA